MDPFGAFVPRSHRPFRRFTYAVVALAVGLAVLPGVASALTRPERAHRAAGFVASQQAPNGSFPAFSPIGSTADAVVSLVVAGHGERTVDKALAYLERQVERGKAVGVGLQAKVVLAVVATGGNPRRFGGENLVSAIRSTEQPDGRLGDGTAVFDQTLGLLALVAAGRSPSDAAFDWLATAQCPDGGWQYDAPAGPNDDEHCQNQTDPASDFFLSDTNTSALAVQALEAGGGTVDPAVEPTLFFDAIRDVERGGWGFTWGFQTTDANSTALVIQAYVALGVPLPDGAMPALKALQYRRCGAFAFTWVPEGTGEVRGAPDLGATIGAILGLLLQPLPLEAGEVHGPAAATPECPA